MLKRPTQFFRQPHIVLISKGYGWRVQNLAKKIHVAFKNSEACIWPACPDDLPLRQAVREILYYSGRGVRRSIVPPYQLPPSVNLLTKAFQLLRQIPCAIERR